MVHNNLRRIRTRYFENCILFSLYTKTRIRIHQYIGLGRATFFMVRAGFRARGFGSGRARATGNVHGLITGHNISYSGHIRAAFGPHLGRIWATFGPPLYINNVNKTQKIQLLEF